MLLATPITAVIKILFEKMELTAPVAELLAGRTDAPRSTLAFRVRHEPTGAASRG